MIAISFCITVLGVLALHDVQGQELPYDYAAYQSLLSLPPYHTPCDVGYTTFWDYSVYGYFSNYAGTYNIGMHYFSQWYALIQGTCPTISPTALNSMLDGYGAEMQRLMQARNIPFALPALPCNPWHNPFYPGGSLPAAPKNTALNSDVALAYRNAYAAIDPLMPGLPYSSMSYFRDIATANLPAECLAHVNAIGNMIGTNMRYSLGMSGRSLNSYYPVV